MIDNLVYDVGMNNGDDSAFYLFKGFRVVAIEADPTLIKEAEKRFLPEIAAGRLLLVNCAISAAGEDVAPFWICEGKSKWNSFDRAVASRDGHSCHAIDVRRVPFEDVLHEHGVPYYLKIDIEGHDHYCVAAIDAVDAPKYISVEMEGLEDLIRLRDKGYDRFKIIRQEDFSQLRHDPPDLASLVKRWVHASPAAAAAMRSAGRIRRLIHQPPPPWPFVYGSSGPFGEEAAGEWQTFNEAAYTIQSKRLGYCLSAPSPELDWLDLHAARPD